MPATPTLTLCDQLVAALLGAWADRGAGDGAERAYFKRVADASNAPLKLEGRRVVVYPTDYDNGPADRGEDLYTHTVTVDVFERYADAGDPTNEWIDERVDFVFTQVVQGFDYGRQPPAWNPFLRTLSADVTVCDVDSLLGRGKLFFSRVEIVFEETRGA